MDIKVIIRRSTVFTLLVITITAIYSFLLILFSKAFEVSLGQYSDFIINIAVSVLIVAGFQPLKAFIQKTTNKFLFKEEYDPQAVLSELAEALSSSIELSHLFDNIDRIVSKTFHPDRLAVSLFDEEQKVFRAVEPEGFKAGETAALDFTEEDLAIKYFKNHRELLVVSELERRLEVEGSNSLDPVAPQLLKRLGKTGAEVFLPLFTKDELIGIAILGAKKSGDVYTTQDISLLEIGGSQAAVAIENAKLYEGMRQFNVRLKKEVDKATRELKNANIRLRKLDAAKSEFISIASHQLRTPLTVIKGYISMMLEGNFGKLTSEEVESLKKVYESNERLIKLVEDLLNVSRIESGRLQFTFKPDSIDKLLASVVDELKTNAQNKKLQLTYLAPKKPAPDISMDTDKLRQVLLNLVDNAVKYTAKGTVTISLSQVDKASVIIKVVDTGMGISPDDMPNLFQKFNRGQGTALVHTEGTGLGLFVAKKIVVAHGGKIWAESKGNGKGSTFVVELPVKTNAAQKEASQSKSELSEAKQ